MTLTAASVSAIPTTRPLAQLLIESARAQTGPLGPAVAGLDFESVLIASSEHRITPAVARRVRSAPDAPERWTDLLRPHRHAQLLRHMQASGDLAVLSDALQRTGIAWAVGKGPVAADLIWPHPDMREYYDVDVYVERRDFEGALDALCAAGFVLVDRNWPELRRTMRAELALRGPTGTHLDLHWDIAVRPSVRRAFRTDMAGMLARAREAQLGSGVPVRVFDDIDTAVHLAFHAAEAGANRLMWAGDLHFATHLPGFSWEVFVDRTLAARAGLAVGLVVERVGLSLGFEQVAPPSVAALASGPWARAARARAARAPFPWLPGDQHAGAGLFSSARPTLAGTLAEATRGSWERRRIERRVARRGADERVLYRDVPDEAAQRAYLRRVTRG